MIIFGISFLDQTGNFLLSSYFFIGGGEGRGRGVFPVFLGGGGREGGESIAHSGPVKNIITMFSCQWVHFFFPYLVQLMVTIYHFPCIVYLK